MALISHCVIKGAHGSDIWGWHNIVNLFWGNEMNLIQALQLRCPSGSAVLSIWERWGTVFINCDKWVKRTMWDDSRQEGHCEWKFKFILWMALL
jgi:hypothetical protein